MAADYLEELLDIADLDGDIDTYIDGDRAHVSIVSESNALVGKDGQVLDALQELTRLAVLAETGQRSRLMLDVAGYRGKRRTELVALAGDAVQEVKDSVRAGAPEGDEPVRAQDRPRRRGCGRADERVGGRRASSSRGRSAGAWLTRPDPTSSPGAADHESAAPGDVSEAVVRSIYAALRASCSISRYKDILVSRGIEWGLLGPREVDRIWGRHILNSAAVAELIPDGASVADVGSGAGLPGIPVALLRPDLTVDLIEPLLRRSTLSYPQCG